MKTMLIISLFLFLSYCTFGVIFLFIQRGMIYPGQRKEILNPYPLSSGDIETFWLDRGSYKVEVWYLPPTQSEGLDPHPLVIIAHGNGEFIDYWPDKVRNLRNRRVGVLLVEYPGYGRSTGNPSQKRIREAFVEAYDMIVQREEVDQDRVLLLGFSLGSGVVSDLSKYRPSNGIILVAGFSSISWFTQQYLLPNFLIRDKYDNVSAMKKYTNPVLIIHAKDDPTVPYQNGVLLNKAANDPVMITHERGGHGGVIPDWNEFWEHIDLFLSKTGIFVE